MSDDLTLPEKVRQSSLLQSLADAIWRRIRQEIYEMIQKAIYEGLDTIESENLANAACGAGTPGTELAASETPIGALKIPFGCRVVSIDTVVYPSGGSSAVWVYCVSPAGGSGWVTAGTEILAGSTLVYYLNSSTTTEVLTCNVILRRVTTY